MQVAQITVSLDSYVLSARSAAERQLSPGTRIATRLQAVSFAPIRFMLMPTGSSKANKRQSVMG